MEAFRLIIKRGDPLEVRNAFDIAEAAQLRFASELAAVALVYAILRGSIEYRGEGNYTLSKRGCKLRQTLLATQNRSG